MGPDYLFLREVREYAFQKRRGKASRIQAQRAEKTKDIEAYLNAVKMNARSPERRPSRFWQTRRANTACVCPPVRILSFRLRLGENGRHVFAERERDGLVVVGEPIGFAALVQQIGEQES